MSEPIRLVLALLTYAFGAAALATALFIPVLMVAGPHAGLLPGWAGPIVLALAWAVILLLPMLPTLWVWRHLGRASR